MDNTNDLRINFINIKQQSNRFKHFIQEFKENEKEFYTKLYLIKIESEGIENEKKKQINFLSKETIFKSNKN